MPSEPIIVAQSDPLDAPSWQAVRAALRDVGRVELRVLCDQCARDHRDAGERVVD